MAFANVTRADLSTAEDAEQGARTTVKARTWVEGWLSVARFAPYLEASAGDVDLAIELYEWNVTLGQVLMRDIAHFEVALRNTYDALMQSRWDGNEHWLLDETSPVRRPIWRTSAQGKIDANRINRRTIDTVVRGMGAACSSDALVAGLTLGFWVHLTDRTRDVTLWRTHLFRAWPKGTNRRDLQRKLNAILRMRNRVAHGERLFNQEKPELLPHVVDDHLVCLFGELCPEAAGRLYAGNATPVESLLEKRPAPVEVAA